MRNPGPHFGELVSPQVLEVPEGGRIPSFGVFLKGAGNDSDSEKSVLVVRIPYLGLEHKPQPGSQETWGLSEFIRQLVDEPEQRPFGDEGLFVHQAIFVALNNGPRRFHCRSVKVY